MFVRTNPIIWLLVAALGGGCGRLGFEQLDGLSIEESDGGSLSAPGVSDDVAPASNGSTPGAFAPDAGMAAPGAMPAPGTPSGTDADPGSGGRNVGTEGAGAAAAGPPGGAGGTATGGALGGASGGGGAAGSETTGSGGARQSGSDGSAGEGSSAGGGVGAAGASSGGGAGGGGGGTCVDGAANQDETDTDCGGVCAPCAVGGSCDDDVDCTSSTCIAGVCRVSGTCSDGEVNQDETDADCGGSVCPQCGVSLGCEDDSDCESDLCMVGLCRAPGTCSDATLNQDETDTDCGGSVCPQCGDGSACDRDLDCSSASCVAETCQGTGSCSDSVQNQDETDIDCGGTTCPACPAGAACEDGGDCEGGLCASQVCTTGGGSCADTTDCTCDNYAGHDYWFCRQPTRGDEAPTTCSTVGMTLVRIDDADENAWVAATAALHGLYAMTDLAIIGATKLNTDPDWVWPDGEAFWTGTSKGMPLNGLYNNWINQSPRGSVDCAAIFPDELWYSLTCGSAQPFVCESP